MTMPHLMNCPHMDNGWCIPCVKELGEERQQLAELVDRLPVTADGMRVVYGDIIWQVDQDGLVLDYRVIGGDANGIEAFPNWGSREIHTWPDDIDGLYPPTCYVMRENADRAAEEIRAGRETGQA